MQEDSWFGIPQGMPDPMVGPRRCRSSSQLPDPLPLRAARARRRGSSGTQSPVSAPLHPPPGRAAGTRRGVPLAQRLAAAAALDRPPPPHLDVLAALCEESTVVLPSLATDAPLASLGATCEDSPLAADGAALPPSSSAASAARDASHPGGGSAAAAAQWRSDSERLRAAAAGLSGSAAPGGGGPQTPASAAAPRSAPPV